MKKLFNSNEKKLKKEKIVTLLISALPTFLLEFIINKISSNNNHYPAVICYHSFTEDETDDLYSISTDNFEKQIKYFLKNKYQFVWEKEYKKSNKKTVMISIDDGYTDNYLNLFPIVKKYGVKVSINLITDEIHDDDTVKEYMSLSQIKEMSDSGLVSFESHTCSHHHLAKCSPEQIEYELIHSKNELKRLLGIESTVCACPKESANDTVIDFLSENYDIAFNFHEHPKHLSCIHRIYTDDKMSIHKLVSCILLDIVSKIKKNY